MITSLNYEFIITFKYISYIYKYLLIKDIQQITNELMILSKQMVIYTNEREVSEEFA